MQGSSCYTLYRSTSILHMPSALNSALNWSFIPILSFPLEPKNGIYCSAADLLILGVNFLICREQLLHFLTVADTRVLVETTRCLSQCFTQGEAVVVLAELGHSMADFVLQAIMFILQSSTSGQLLFVS